MSTLEPFGTADGGRRRLRPVALASLMLASLVLPIPGEAVACASTHGRAYLAGFTGGPAAGSPFYAVGEDEGSVNVAIRVTPGHCIPQSGSTAIYRTENGVAIAGQDYSGIPNTESDLLCADVDQQEQWCGFLQPQQTVNVAIINDSDETAAAVEPFLFKLGSGQPFGLAEPSSAPIHIIDVDGPNRVSLEPSLTGGTVAYQKSEFGSVLIPVFWAGSNSAGSVHYSVEPDPASPALPGEDYAVASPNPLPVTNRLGFIQVDIVGDKLVENDESVIITLLPEPGYEVAAPSTTTFTILDNEESGLPSSKFHHPRHKWKYRKSDFRIREFHVFTTDNPGGSGVVAAEIALRRNLRNGTCVWLTPQGWQKKDCQNRQWLSTKYDDVGELFYHRMKQLKSSVGTKIKDYTAFSRAIDAAENIEKDFVQKRNDNTFEIKKKKKRRG